jgi:phage major head subunit gpT-like protein
MIINTANMAILARAFNASFNKGLGTVKPTYSRIATTVPSSTKTNDYPWLGKIPGLIEWIGDRQINNLAKHGYSITNKPFESTIAVDRDELEDDTYGVYSPMMETLGTNAAIHPDKLIYALLAAGFATPCYDGQYFFDTDHSVLDASGAPQSVSNMQSGAGNPWFLLDTTKPLKPLIYQERKKAKFVSLTQETDQNVFMRKEYLYGVDYRGNVGFGFWQMAFGSKDTLGDTNFNSAYAAMGAFKDDYGNPLGIMPDLLVVGPSNRAAAKTVIEAENNAAGASNINYKAVEVMVVPWLA